MIYEKIMPHKLNILRISWFIILVTAIGLEEEKYNSELTEIEKIFVRMQDNLAIQLITPVPVGIWERFFPSGKQQVQDRMKVTEIFKDLLEKKRQQDAPINIDNTVPLFDLIVNVVAKCKPEREIIDEVAFFVTAATETSGCSLTFCFTLLGMHPEIQETLYKEVINQVGFNTISNDDLSNLKYTEAVISEALRLFPPSPVIVRLICENVDLGKKVVPKDTNFLIDIFHMHRDKKYWSNPLKFDPSRFLPENASKIVQYSFLPFSGGPRDCIGKDQAMKLMKITVANVIRRFKIVSKYKSVEEIALRSSILLKPENPIDCEFFLRPVE